MTPARSSPRAGTAESARRTPRSMHSARSTNAERTHRGRHSRAVQSHRPHGSVLRGAHRRRDRQGLLRGLRPESRRGRRRRAARRRGRYGHGRHPSRRGRGVPARLADGGATSSTVRHREVGLDSRRPSGGTGRQQPVDHRHCGAPAGARAAVGERRDHRRHRNRRRRRPVTDRARGRRRTHGSPARRRRDRRSAGPTGREAAQASGRPHRTAHPRPARSTARSVRPRPPPGLRRGRPDTRKRPDRRRTSSTSTRSTSRRHCSAATSSRSATSESAGMPDIRRLDIRSVEQLGNDLFISARPPKHES